MSRNGSYFTAGGRRGFKEIKREPDTLSGILSVSVSGETERLTA